MSDADDDSTDDVSQTFGHACGPSDDIEGKPDWLIAKEFMEGWFGPKSTEVTP